MCLFTCVCVPVSTCACIFALVSARTTHNARTGTLVPDKYVCMMTNSTWNCRSPGRFKPHVASSQLTYSGRVPPISPRSEWNLGTTYLQMQSFEVQKGNLCVYSNEINLKLPFTWPLQTPRVGESVDIRNQLETAFHLAVANPTCGWVSWHIYVYTYVKYIYIYTKSP